MIELKIIKTIYETEKGANGIFEVIYNKEPCYAVINRAVQFVSLFNYDENILQKVIRKAKRTGIICEKKKSGIGFLFKFKKTETEKGIALRSFLYSKYHSLHLDKIKNANIKLRDESGKQYRIADFRSNNLYNAGDESIESVKIISRPKKPDEKYIVYTYNGTTEIQDYSDTLYKILKTKAYCMPSKGKRLRVAVHHSHSRDGSKLQNLSRFVLQYYEYFDRYKNMNGAIRRFISAIPSITDNRKGEDCGHINARKWNNSRGNIAYMDNHTNIVMADFIKKFRGMYRAFAVGLKGDYLIVLTVNEKQLFYICHSTNDYYDLQRTLLGKSAFLGNAVITKINKEPHSVNTPKQEIDNAVNDDSPMSEEETITEFWKWCDRRDLLYGIYQCNPQCFKEWVAVGDKGLNAVDFMKNILPMLQGAIDGE